MDQTDIFRTPSPTGAREGEEVEDGDATSGMVSTTVSMAQGSQVELWRCRLNGNTMVLILMFYVVVFFIPQIQFTRVHKEEETKNL